MEKKANVHYPFIHVLDVLVTDYPIECSNAKLNVTIIARDSKQHDTGSLIKVSKNDNVTPCLDEM